MIYSRTYPDFWSSKVSDLDDTCRALAHYLYSANVPTWGLYCRCLAAVAHEFKRSESVVREAFSALQRIEYAYIDERTGWIWVKEMAAYQLRPLPISLDNFMVKSARRWYAALPKNPFLGPFWDRYCLDLRLDHPDAFPGSQVSRREWGGPGTSEVYALLPMPVEATKPPSRREDFERWLSYYPKRKQAPRKPAFDVWTRRKIPSSEVSGMIATLVEQLKNPDWTKDGRKYVPHADRYLRQEMDKDQPTEIVESGNPWRCPHTPRCPTRERCDDRYYREEVERP